MHEWFKIRSGLEQGFLSYAHMHAATKSTIIRLVEDREDALLNYFRHLISFSYWEKWWFTTYTS